MNCILFIFAEVADKQHRQFSKHGFGSFSNWKRVEFIDETPLLVGEDVLQSFSVSWHTPNPEYCIKGVKRLIALVVVPRRFETVAERASFVLSLVHPLG